MPLMDELIDRLGHCKYITTLDLTKGYWQIPLAKNDRAKAAFTTPFGHFQFRVMPFGLQGAPATFQRLMDVLIRGLESYAAAYLDDIVIFSENWEEHLKHLRHVLERLKGAGLTANPKKCKFAMGRCVYLGHIVGSGLVQPEESKVVAIRTFPIPKSKQQVRAFLGLAGYYRKFIPNFSATAAPLTDLTRKMCPNSVKWNAECELAFQTIKGCLCSTPVLCAPRNTEPAG